MSLDAGGGGRMSLDEATSTRPSGEDGEGLDGGSGGRVSLDDAGSTSASAPPLPPPPLRVRVPEPAPASVLAPGLSSAPLADDVGSFGNGVDGNGTRSGFNFGLVVDKAYLAGVALSPQPLKPLTTDLPMPMFGNGVIAAKVPAPPVPAAVVGAGGAGVLTPALTSGVTAAPVPVVTSPSKMQPPSPSHDRMEVDEEVRGRDSLLLAACPEAHQPALTTLVRSRHVQEPPMQAAQA